MAITEGLTLTLRNGMRGFRTSRYEKRASCRVGSRGKPLKESTFEDVALAGAEDDDAMTGTFETGVTDVTGILKLGLATGVGLTTGVNGGGALSAVIRSQDPLMTWNSGYDTIIAPKRGNKPIPTVQRNSLPNKS